MSRDTLTLACVLIFCTVILAVQQHMQHTAQAAALRDLFERVPQMTITAHDAWSAEQRDRDRKAAEWKSNWDKEQHAAELLAAALKRIPAHVTDPALRERAAQELVKIEREALRHPQPGETESERIMREVKNATEP